MATFRSVTASTPGSYVIKVHIKSSSGSYFIMKRAMLHATTSQFNPAVKKSVQLNFAANFGLISGKHEFFQATLENHFYKIYPNNQVIVSNFKFRQGMCQLVFFLSTFHVLVSLAIFNIHKFIVGFSSHVSYDHICECNWTSSCNTSLSRRTITSTLESQYLVRQCLH